MSNRKILQKVIDALKADKKEYAMGILDTLIENEPEEFIPTPKQVTERKEILTKFVPIAQAQNDEGSMIDREAHAKMKSIDLSAIQTQ